MIKNKKITLIVAIILSIVLISSVAIILIVNSNTLKLDGIYVMPTETSKYVEYKEGTDFSYDFGLYFIAFNVSREEFEEAVVKVKTTISGQVAKVIGVTEKKIEYIDKKNTLEAKQYQVSYAIQDIKTPLDIQTKHIKIGEKTYNIGNIVLQRIFRYKINDLGTKLIGSVSNGSLEYNRLNGTGKVLTFSPVLNPSRYVDVTIPQTIQPGEAVEITCNYNLTEGVFSILYTPLVVFEIENEMNYLQTPSMDFRYEESFSLKKVLTFLNDDSHIDLVK